jgi:dihydropyrimidinase
MKIEAKVDKVMSRGKIIIDGDDYVGTKGDGQYLKRGMSQLLI